VPTTSTSKDIFFRKKTHRYGLRRRNKNLMGILSKVSSILKGIVFHSYLGRTSLYVKSAKRTSYLLKRLPRKYKKKEKQMHVYSDTRGSKGPKYVNIFG
jgi:hypothetical protein